MAQEAVARLAQANDAHVAYISQLVSRLSAHLASSAAATNAVCVCGRPREELKPNDAAPAPSAGSVGGEPAQGAGISPAERSHAAALGIAGEAAASTAVDDAVGPKQAVAQSSAGTEIHAQQQSASSGPTARELELQAEVRDFRDALEAVTHTHARVAATARTAEVWRSRAQALEARVTALEQRCADEMRGRWQDARVVSEAFTRVSAANQQEDAAQRELLAYCTALEVENRTLRALVRPLPQLTPEDMQAQAADALQRAKAYSRQGVRARPHPARETAASGVENTRSPALSALDASAGESSAAQRPSRARTRSIGSDEEGDAADAPPLTLPSSGALTTTGAAVEGWPAPVTTAAAPSRVVPSVTARAHANTHAPEGFGGQRDALATPSRSARGSGSVEGFK